MEDIFITKLYSSGVLRYSETNSDMDGFNKMKLTKKGPNSLGNTSERRIPIRQRVLHPSMLGALDLLENSSDVGQTASLSPFTQMDSLYFDNSNYENELHFRLKKLIEKLPVDEDCEEIRIKADTEEQYNSILDKLFQHGDGSLRAYGVSNMPLEIIIEKDPRDKYRKFDESNLEDISMKPVFGKDE